MALNYVKSGQQAIIEILQDVVVVPGGFHIVGKQLGVAITGGVQGDTITVALDGVWELPCEGDSFEGGDPLHFSVSNLALYAGIPESQDFENIAIAWTDGGGSLETCLAKINGHIATLTA